MLPGSMCRHGTVHHVDLRGNNLIGTVPKCAWSGDHALGNGNLYLSRNSLSGTVGRLGKGHRNVHINDNRLSGDLGRAVRDAESLKVLSAGGNKFTGTLDSLRGKKHLRHVHVEGNALTDTVELPVASVLASLPELQSYDISGNRFFSHESSAKHDMSNPGVDRVALGAAASLGAPTSTSRRKVTTSATIFPTSIHVVIHLGVPIAHICPMCGGDDGQEANCGAVPECRKHPDVLKNVPDGLPAKGSLYYIAPLIAPDCAQRRGGGRR